MQPSVPCMILRGGTSKGACFLADCLPHDSGRRDALPLSIMGSPDPRQIKGVAGAHPLTSKIAIVCPARPEPVWRRSRLDAKGPFRSSIRLVSSAW